MLHCAVDDTDYTNPTPSPALPKALNPPTSPGLPPSGRTRTRRDKAIHRYPGKPGRPTLKRTEEITATTLALMDSKTPVQIAKGLGTSIRAEKVRDVIKAARVALALRAQDYVDLHFQAASIAAESGDAKPSQWALTMIAEEGARIVDAPQVAQNKAPSLQIGIALGGLTKGTEPLTLTPLSATTIDITEDAP